MPTTDRLLLGAELNGEPNTQSLKLANRHGLVAGATGTGKTVTLQRLAEQFSDAGVAVFAADIKGDLCGLGVAGAPQGKIAERIASMSWRRTSWPTGPATVTDVPAIFSRSTPSSPARIHPVGRLKKRCGCSTT